MAAEAAVNVLCFLVPWLSPWKCLVNTEAGGGAAGEGYDQATDDISNSMGDADAAAAAAAASNEATEAALRDLGNATTTLLASIGSARIPRTHEEWVALLHSSGASTRAYVGALGGFIRKADVWYAAVLIVLLLMITAKIWTKFLSELLENLFRKPMREKMGIKYETIKVSAFRLSLSVRQLELRPSESELAKTIVVAIIPSADVTSPPLQMKGGSGDQDNKIADKLHNTKSGGEGQHRRSSGSNGSNDLVPDPFRGSDLRIREIGMGCSFHLVKVMPLVSLVRKWREYKELRKVLRPKTTGTSSEEVELESEGGGNISNEIALEEGVEHFESSAKYSEAGGDATQKKPEDTWLRFFAFYIPAPHIRVRVKGVDIKVDKAYLASEPPEGFVPTHRHQRSVSFFGEDALNPVFDEDNTVATDSEALPSAIIPKSADRNGDMAKSLPVFAGQDTMLQAFAGEGRSEADSIIFHMERWVENTSKKYTKKKRSMESSKKVEKSTSKKPNATDGGYKTDETSGSRRYELKSRDEGKVEEGMHDDVMNFLLKSILRRVLSSVEVECAEMSLTISGADAPTVKNARNSDAVEPYRANVALSRLGWHQRALTVLSIESVFVSFQGPNCTLKVAIGGISMQVGMPPKRKHSSNGCPSPPSSPGRRGVSNTLTTFGAGVGQKRNRRRTWYTLIPSDNDIAVNISGVLPILVWALNYDHHWQKRKLGINVVMSKISFRLESLPLFTALVHLDDFADPDSSHGEWATWLRRKHHLGISPLSDVERATYRKCYRKIKGIKEVVQLERGGRGVLVKEQKPSYLNATQDTESPAIPPVKDAVGAGAPSPEAAKEESRVNGGSEREILCELESRMTCDEILEERCIVLRDKWKLSASNPELQEFLVLTKSELLKRKKSPRIMTAAVPQSTAPQDSSRNDGLLQSPFEQTYTSPVDILVCLVREKFHLFAPSVDISARVGAVQLHFIDRSFGERAAKLKGKSSNIVGSSHDIMSTTLAIQGILLEIHQQSIVFSSFEEDSSPRTFQNISLAVDNIRWQPDVTSIGDIHLLTFIDESPCGIIYKKDESSNVVGTDTTHPVNSMIALALEHKKDATKSSSSHLAIDLCTGNLVFVMNPIPLASSLAVLMSFADLPFRDLAAEKEAQEAVELEKNGDGIASFRQSTMYTFSTTAKSEEDVIPPPVGILFGGANMSLTVQLSNVTVVPLPDATGVNKGTVEATIQDISLVAESSGDGVEAAEISVAPFKVLRCRLFYVPNNQGGFVKPFHSPLKPALEFGGSSISYSSRPKESIVVPVSSPKVAVGDGRLEEHYVFDVCLTAYTRRVVTYLSPSINASLLGALNCVSVIVEYLPAPEEAAMDLGKITLRQEEEDRSSREALKELWRMADRDGSGTLSVDEVSEIIARLFSAKAQNIFDEMPKSQQLTERELKREVQYFLSLAGSNSAATRDLSFPEVEFLLFQKQKLQESGMSASEHAAQSRDFGSIEGLRGLIYYEDLLEYSSSTQVYALTGTLHTSKFPPPSSWRQGEGIKLFWELYERETGCTKASLNDQRLSDVQRKLVRVLLNYNFAKYCWKTLVKPALLQSQQEEDAETPTTPRRVSRRITDWVIDKNTKTKLRSGALDLFASHVKKLETDIDNFHDRSSSDEATANVVYDVNVLLEVDEASAKIGNGLTFATPLVDASLTRINVTLAAQLDPSSSTGILASTLTSEGSQHSVDGKALSQEDKNKLHFEFVVATKVQNTKHAKMEDFLEPFSAYGNFAYALKEMPATGGETEKVNTRELSCKVMLPKFVSINVSPSVLDTTSKLNEIVNQSSLDAYETLSMELQIEGVRDLWNFLDKDISEELSSDDVLIIMEHFLGVDYGSDSGVQVEKIIEATIAGLDADNSGTLSFPEIEDQIRSKQVMLHPADIRIENQAGVSMKFSCRSFMDRKLAMDPSISPTSLIATFDNIRHNGRRQITPDVSTIEAAKKDGIIIAVPGCKIIDVPVLVYQSLMVHLKSVKFARRRRRRTRENDSQNASGFEPYLTLVPISEGLDSVTIQARSPLTVTAETPINIRVVKTADLGPLHGRKANRERDHTVNLAKRNLDFYFKQLAAEAPIVFERNNLKPGTKIGLPINIMLSSSFHFLLVGDVAKDGNLFWREPVLLTKNFLFNPRHISEVARCHAASGISVQRNRLNVHKSSRSSRASSKKASKIRTAWDSTIVVMPSFVLTNALPFNIQFRCWQLPAKTEDWKKADLFAGGPTPSKSKLRTKVVGTDEIGSSDEELTPSAAPGTGGRRYARHRKLHSHAFEGTANQQNQAFVNVDNAPSGANVLLNGINTKEKLYIQIAQNVSSENNIDPLLWTEPLCVDMKKLRCGGNRFGSMTLPVLKGTIGDDADYYLDVSVEHGVPYCSIYAPYWLNNKTGMKMMLKFSGRDDTMYDGGSGGLPIMAMCHVSGRKEKNDQREVSIIPLEGASLEGLTTWWDESTNGQLVMNPPPLNSKGKSLVEWSKGISLDAVGQLGECRCKQLIFGVSIETLTGAFYRTNSIVFTPRFIVKNCMHIPITILPVAGTMADVERLAKRMTDYGLGETLQRWKMRPDAFTELQMDQSTVVYQFEDASKHKSENDKHRYYLIRIDADTWDYMEQWHIIKTDVFGSSYHVERDGVRDSPAGIVKVDVQQSGPTTVTSVMISPRSPFRCENRSTSHYIQFVQDDHSATVIELPPMSFCSFSWDNPYGKKRIRVVSIPRHKSREYLTEQACKAASPTGAGVHVDADDNDSNSLVFHQSDDEPEQESDILTSMTLDASTRERLEEVKNVQSFNRTDSQFVKRKRLYSRRSKAYNPQIVGTHKPLPCESLERSSHSALGGVLDHHHAPELFVECRILAGSRVLSFNDSKWRMHQSEIGAMRSGGFWKSANYDVFALGATISLIDDFPHELMSMTARHLSVYKRKGEISTTCRLRHVQVDSMFQSAQYPVILEPLPLGVDRRISESGELSLMMSKYNDGKEASPNDFYWVDTADWPMPFFEASISYLPQKHMTWIPSLNVYLSPLKCQIELSYLLRIADLLINSLPEPNASEVLRDTLQTLELVNCQLDYPTRSRHDTTLTYIEKFSILPTFVETELDVRPDEGAGGTADDDEMGGDSMVTLSSLGKQTSSNLSAGLLTWFNNVAAKFAHVSPKFKYDGMNRIDTYANAEDLLYEVISFYMFQTIYQSYKVVFSMQLFGDPQDLVDHYKTGVSDLANIVTGDQAVGKGLTSATKNVFGGTLDFAGKITGEFSDLLDSIVTNEYTSKDLKPKKSHKREDAAGNIGDGVIEGTQFLGMTLLHGVAGVVGNPYRGLKKGSAKAVAKGMVSGVGGLVVAPFIGALGFTAKVLEGTGNTTSLLEVGVIESRCRPARIVQWGTSIGQVVMPYIKGIGIRIHSVRYQKKYKGAKLKVGSFDDEEDQKPHTAKEFRQAKTAYDKRRHPGRRTISLMRLRDKEHILSTAKKPKLLEDEDEDASSIPEVSKYVIIYEETLTLRCSDMQLSDVIAVYLWHYKSIATTSTRNKPLGLCKFTVGDAFKSMQQYYGEQILQRQVELSQHSTVKSETSTMPSDGRRSTPLPPRGINKGDDSSLSSVPPLRTLANRVAERREQIGRATKDFSTGTGERHGPVGMLGNIAQARKTAEATEVESTAPTHSRSSSAAGNITGAPFLPSPDDEAWVVPTMQEFALMNPVPMKSRAMRRNLASAITEEMASIKRAEERATAFFESETDEYSEDSDFDMDGQAKIMDDEEEDSESKLLEHLHGHIMLSFFPIPW